MRHNPGMTLTDPVSRPAQPDLTGGRRIGVLLQHGFTGSPASMAPWADHLAALGYAIEAPLLPGHGTRWQDLNTKRWSDWYAETSRAFDRLSAANDAVVVGGLSMGGALVLRLAEDHPDKVAGVVVVNPAVATKRFDVKLLPVLKHLVPSFPGLANDIKKPNIQEHGYDRTPLKAIHSLISTWPEIVTDLPKITSPLLYLRSTEDHVVDGASEPLIMAKISSRDVTQVPLPNSYHVATLDNDAPTIFEESAAFIARVTA